MQRTGAQSQLSHLQHNPYIYGSKPTQKRGWKDGGPDVFPQGGGFHIQPWNLNNMKCTTQTDMPVWMEEMPLASPLEEGQWNLVVGERSRISILQG